MCGIVGIHDRGPGAVVTRAAVEVMSAQILHRGPDDQGAFLDGPIGLGHRRLSIIDPQLGHQPITNEDGSVVVVANGEIYNFVQLRHWLVARGHRFRSRSDNEVIVHLYEERGDELLHELRGMFAFALWDRTRQRLLIARDRLGIKPVYFSDTGEQLRFASEIKALVATEDRRTSVDLDAVVHFLTTKYVPAPATMFAGVSSLPPGHLLVSDSSGTTVQQWWDLSFRPADPPLNEHDAAERLRSLLRDAVRSHLVSDVPFGAFLSGGVDSSLIVALMSEALDEPVRTFSVGYEGDGASVSELRYARLVAERFGTVHHEVLVGPDDLVRRLPDLLWHLDQPIADEACLPNLLVSELAAQHVKMVLTGEGGDELFAGYARYAGERFVPLAAAIPAPAGRAFVRALDRLPGLRRPKLASRALLEHDEAMRMLRWFPLFGPDVVPTLLTPEVRAQVDTGGPRGTVLRTLAASDASDRLSRMLYHDTKLWLPDDLLARGDKTSMAAGLEARVPLLDHPLAEFAAGLPPGLKLRGRTRKYLLRRVAAEWLPAEILRRPKQGFPTPVSAWFRGPARQLLEDELAPSTLREGGILDPGAVRLLIDRHCSGAADNGSLLFGVLSLQLWLRMHQNGRP